MTIGIGRHRLIVALTSSPEPKHDLWIAAAEEASDRELATLQSTRDALQQRAQWEALGIMHGAGRMR